MVDGIIKHDINMKYEGSLAKLDNFVAKLNRECRYGIFISSPEIFPASPIGLLNIWSKHKNAQ